MPNILFDIGDYSCDGHNFYATFMVKTNKTAEELQTIHMKENQFIGSLCKEYNENYIYVYDLYEFLSKYMSHGEAVKFLHDFAKEEDTEVLIENDDEVEEMSIDEEEYHTFHMYSPATMLNLWLKLLQVIDKTMEYEVISEAMSAYFMKYKGLPEKSDGSMIPRQYIGMEIPGYGVWGDSDDMEFYHG